MIFKFPKNCRKKVIDLITNDNIIQKSVAEPVLIGLVCHNTAKIKIVTLKGQSKALYIHVYI